MKLNTTPAHVHLQCVHCDKLVSIPINIEASEEPREDKTFVFKVRFTEIDYQPLFDHQLFEHMDSPE